MSRIGLVWVLVVIGGLALIIGTALPLFFQPSIFTPFGRRAAEISGLGAGVLAAGGLIFILVEALLIYTTLRFRERRADDSPQQTHGNVRLEIVWTGIPVLIVIVLVFMTIQTMISVASPPAEAAEEPIVVDVIGHQWWWEFRYPDLGIVSANEMHVPVGQPVRVRLTSVDVIHSFWVPPLAGKQDAMPGRVTELWLEADEPGLYLGFCGEFCGVQHAWMRIAVFAHPREEYQAWIQRRQSVPQAPTGGLEAEGQQVYLSKTCVSCHAIAGTPSNGQVGPDLTGFGDRYWIAGGVLRNTPENLERWLADPQGIKPGNNMPYTPVTERELQALVAYLESLR